MKSSLTLIQQHDEKEDDHHQWQQPFLYKLCCHLCRKIIVVTSDDILKS